jgi:cytochrome c biogenesis protein CcdA
MKLIDVLFYHFYNFYRRWPFYLGSYEFNAAFSIGFFLSVGIALLVMISMIPLTGKWSIIIGLAIIMGCGLLFERYFGKSGRWKNIIKTKPFIVSRGFSIGTTIAFVIIETAFAVGVVLLAMQNNFFSTKVL